MRWRVFCMALTWDSGRSISLANKKTRGEGCRFSALHLKFSPGHLRFMSEGCGYLRSITLLPIVYMTTAVIGVATASACRYCSDYCSQSMLDLSYLTPHLSAQSSQQHNSLHHGKVQALRRSQASNPFPASHGTGQLKLGIRICSSGELP